VTRPPLEHAAAAARIRDSVHSLDGRWRAWGAELGLQVCRGCRKLEQCRGLRRGWPYCFRCFAAGLVYTRTRTRTREER